MTKSRFVIRKKMLYFDNSYEFPDPVGEQLLGAVLAHTVVDHVIYNMKEFRFSYFFYFVGLDLILISRDSVLMRKTGLSCI